jgi:hypothetical protein
VSRAETIQRLESLLERVRTRAAQPRIRAGEAKGEPETAERVGPQSSSLAAPLAPAGVAWPETGAQTELPPFLPRVRVQPWADEMAAAANPSVEAAAGEDHGSVERLVAAEPEAAEAPSTGETSRVQVQESVPPIDVAELEVTGEDEEERAPASSRRVVAPEPEERLAQIAFGAEDLPQPIHTPPPESGRLPAAPSAEFDQDPDVTGVRSATPLLPRRMMESFPRAIEPEVVRPQLASSDAVGEVIAEAQRFAPATFVALLDASLAL